MEKLSQKSSEEYFRNIDSYAEEKTALLVEAIRQNNLPTVGSEVFRILEIGTGGGGGLKRIQEIVAEEGLENAELHAIDILKAPLRSNKVSENSKLRVVAELQKLPYPDSSVSAVNTSSVFHEVAAYGENGDEEIDYAIKELNRILLLNGLWTYRDLGAPADGLEKLRSNEYIEEDICNFVLKFLPVFLSQDEYKYNSDWKIKADGAEFNKNNLTSLGEIKLEGHLVVEAPAGLLREIERHYLAFVKERMLAMVSNSEKDIDNEDALNNFLSTEGREGYFYNSLSTFIERVVKQSLDKENHTVLFTEGSKSIRLISRFGNDELLKKVSTAPLADTKQVIGFRKVSFARAKEILQDIEDLPKESLLELFGREYEVFLNKLSQLLG